MSRIERGFYSLSEIEQRETPKLQLDLNLPEYVDKDQIGVNLKGIDQMCRMGGIRTLYVSGRSGETSSYTPTMVGRTSEGAGMAGKTGIQKKARKYSAHEAGQNKSVFSEGRWIDAEVVINLSEMSNKLSDEKQLRSPGAWAKEINPALKKGIVDAGQAHLIYGASGLEKFMDADSLCIGIWSGSEGKSFGMEVPVPASIATAVIVGSVSWKLIKKMMSNDMNEEGYRLSMFNGPQLDRAVILQGMGKTKRLVKELPKEK